MEGPPEVARGAEHRPRHVPGVEAGGPLREDVGAGSPRVRCAEGDRVGVAVDGHDDNQGSSRGKSTGPNPTDRAKSGTKRNMLVEGNGVPLAVVVAGADRHDVKLAGPDEEHRHREAEADEEAPSEHVPGQKDTISLRWTGWLLSGDARLTSRGRESTSRRGRGSRATGREDGWWRGRTPG